MAPSNAGDSNEDGTAILSGQATPPSGEFASVSAGGVHTCGVRTRRLRRMLGLNDGYGQATPPSGEFASVSAGDEPHLRGEDRRLRRMLGR